METNSKSWWDESIHWGLCGYSFLKTPRSLWLLAAIILIVWNRSMKWAYEQRERVKDITRYLKFCDEEVNKPQSRDGQDQPSPDKLYKVRRFLGKLLPKYDQEWVSHQCLTTDEKWYLLGGGLGFNNLKKATFQIWNQSQCNGWRKQWLHSQATNLHRENVEMWLFLTYQQTTTTKTRFWWLKISTKAPFSLRSYFPEAYIVLVD